MRACCDRTQCTARDMGGRRQVTFSPISCEREGNAVSMQSTCRGQGKISPKDLEADTTKLENQMMRRQLGGGCFARPCHDVRSRFFGRDRQLHSLSQHATGQPRPSQLELNCWREISQNRQVCCGVRASVAAFIARKLAEQPWWRHPNSYNQTSQIVLANWNPEVEKEGKEINL